MYSIELCFLTIACGDCRIFKKTLYLYTSELILAEFSYIFLTFAVEAYCIADCFVLEKSVAQTRKPQCSETGRLRGSCIRRSPPTSYP